MRPGRSPATGAPQFILSLVRQFPNKDEGFFQLHVDVYYEQTKDYLKVEVYLDET